MIDASTFSKIRIGIASPEQIRQWSRGEVKKPETINYRTFKPERDGLFCEKIFGPVKDWECHCGRYKKVKFKGIVCDRCGVEVTRSKVRRERMGHIELASPVCHIWYLKGVPSPLSLILGIPPRSLEKVIYFASYIVISVDRQKINDALDNIRAAVQEEIAHIEHDQSTLSDRMDQKLLEDIKKHDEMVESLDPEGEAPQPWTESDIASRRQFYDDRIKQEEKEALECIQELNESLTLIEKISKCELITEDQYRGLEQLLEVVQHRRGDSLQRLGVNLDGALRAGQGAVAVKELAEEIDLDQLQRELQQEVSQSQGPKRLRAIKRLEIVEAFKNSRTRPEWMILDCIPVISPELRPMVQLDGGRFATSDLNDLYRRIINRNNRLKKITEIRAPESIVNHEKRLLQEAVDALIDNGRRSRPVVGSNNRPLKSLSDRLKGKEGRFRKNLLGKRVDYSGRSVIVVGPHLKLHQCGLPKEMALELFKPFVMKALVERGYTSNIKTAKRMIDKMRPEVWDALDEVISEHPVLLNRAPTLHRLGIQAFEPVLVDGKAIQVHPLVCHAFNADFDGDQMAVHVPLSAYAQAEARVLMLASHNIFKPADGSAVVAPIQDIILGCYYMTNMRENMQPLPVPFSNPDEALLAYQLEKIGLHDPIQVRIVRNGVSEIFGSGDDPSRYTSAGRLIFNEILPDELRYSDRYLFQTMDKKTVANLVTEVYHTCGKQRTIKFLDDIKNLGFRYATQSGVTISMTDMDIPAKREAIITEAEKKVSDLNRQYRRGMITQGERKQQVLNYWMQAADNVADAIMESIDHFNPIYMITDSGARGSTRQITQLSGMRGLMSDPFGNLIEDLPIKSNFHEGLSVLEYFISTHGARKGLADTALRTADAGYLTRRLVDVAQDVIVRDLDCGTSRGIFVEEIIENGEVLEKLSDRIRGRYVSETIFHPLTNNEVWVEAGHEITDEIATEMDGFRVVFKTVVNQSGETVAYAGDTITLQQAEKLVEEGIWRNTDLPTPTETPSGAGKGDGRPDGNVQSTTQLRDVLSFTSSLRVGVRSPFTCELRRGICALCYGRDLASGKRVDIGVAVGIIAAQSIGEPGTQLTMRTFHTGGVAGKYLTGVANVKQKRENTLRELHEDIKRGLVNFSEGIEGPERERGRAIQAMLKVLEDQVGGLLRVVELFEARKPKGQAIITEFSGRVSAIESKGLRYVVIHSKLPVLDETKITGKMLAENVEDPNGELIASAGDPVSDRIARRIREAGIEVITIRETVLVPYRGELEVRVGDELHPGDRLTEGPLDPQKVLELQGPSGVQEYLVREIQSVYKSQGVDINDKHVEVIVRQMLRKRKIRSAGDTRFLPGQVVDKFIFEDENARVRSLDLPGTEAIADWILLGITEASLATDSFLSAASFQKTTRVLTEAAVRGKRDDLLGLKENVIIGRLIPAGTGLPRYRSTQPATPDGSPLVLEPLVREAPLGLPSISDETPAEIITARAELILGDATSDSEIEVALEETEGELAQFPEADDLDLKVSTPSADLRADGQVQGRDDSYEESAPGDFSEEEINLDETASDLDKLTDKAED